MGEGKEEEMSAVGDGGQNAISLVLDVDGIASGILLDLILSTL